MDKDKVFKYLNFKIEVLEKEDIDNKSLDDRCIGKEKFIEVTSRELRAMREAKAFLESGLADND